MHEYGEELLRCWVLIGTPRTADYVSTGFLRMLTGAASGSRL